MLDGIQSSHQISTGLYLLPLETAMFQALVYCMMDGLSGEVGMVSTAAFGHAHLEDSIIVYAKFILAFYLFVHYLININSDQYQYILCNLKSNNYEDGLSWKFFPSFQGLLQSLHLVVIHGVALFVDEVEQFIGFAVKLFVFSMHFAFDPALFCTQHSIIFIQQVSNSSDEPYLLDIHIVRHRLKLFAQFGHGACLHKGGVKILGWCGEGLVGLSVGGGCLFCGDTKITVNWILPIFGGWVWTIDSKICLGLIDFQQRECSFH